MPIDYSPPMTTKKKLTLSQKIAAITNACTEIERKGVGTSTDPNKPLYSYVKVEDVLAMVAPLLKRHKLIVTGQVAKEPVTHVGKTHATTEVLVDWTLTDTEADADPVARDMMYNCARVYRIPGSGADDSGKAIYKAITGSRKYFYVTVFNLQFGDEPEEVQRAQKPEEQAT